MTQDAQNSNLKCQANLESPDQWYLIGAVYRIKRIKHNAILTVSTFNNVESYR